MHISSSQVSSLVQNYSEDLIQNYFSHTHSLTHKTLHSGYPSYLQSLYISSTLGQLVHHLSLHLVALLISFVSKSRVDLSTIPLLLYGTHFLLIFVRLLTIILWPHHPLLYLLLQWCSCQFWAGGGWKPTPSSKSFQMNCGEEGVDKLCSWGGQTPLTLPATTSLSLCFPQKTQSLPVSSVFSSLLRLLWPYGWISPALHDLAIDSSLSTFTFFIFSVSQNKEASICSTFTGT